MLIGRGLNAIVLTGMLVGAVVTGIAPGPAPGSRTSTAPADRATRSASAVRSSSGPVANSVAASGGAPVLGDLVGRSLSQPLVGLASSRDRQGYWLVASDGGVFSFGDAAFYGSTGAIRLNRPVVGMAADPITGGYWLVASDGGVFSFDAPFLGSLGGMHLNAPVLGIAATPDGGGYWLVAADGGVFTFGDAAFYGSLGGMHLNRPVVAMAALPGGCGYWLAGADGGVFTFGAARFAGSTGGIRLNRPVTGMSATPGGGGYWLVASDGGVFNFGDAPFDGTSLTTAAAPAIAISAGGTGYWVAYGQGAVGVAAGEPPPVTASPGGGPGTFPPTGTGVLAGKVVAVDPGHNGYSYTDPAYINAPVWNGRTNEACDTTGTSTNSGYTEAQFNWNVAEYLTAALRALGATVVLTRTTNTGIGPCITQRAAIGNNAGADAAVSIHADGGPPAGRGFAILEPVADGINDAIIGPSQVLGAHLRDAFAAGTGEAVSSYDGVDGIQPRNDLGGTNLSTVPKVFVECANMGNLADAALTENQLWQAQAAAAIAAGLTSYLTGA